MHVLYHIPNVIFVAQKKTNKRCGIKKKKKNAKMYLICPFFIQYTRTRGIAGSPCSLLTFFLWNKNYARVRGVCGIPIFTLYKIAFLSHCCAWHTENEKCEVNGMYIRL